MEVPDKNEVVEATACLAFLSAFLFARLRSAWFGWGGVMEKPMADTAEWGSLPGASRFSQDGGQPTPGAGAKALSKVKPG